MVTRDDREVSEDDAAPAICAAQGAGGMVEEGRAIEVRW
jgi:hypothetical protein